MNPEERMRYNPELRSLMAQWKKIDPNGYCQITDGSCDDMTGQELIVLLKENIEQSEAE
jgi:hypothetical protein